MNKRVFFISHQKCYGLTGGGHGVMYRLYKSNKIYHYFDNVYFIFEDRVIYGTGDSDILAANPSRKRSNVRSFRTVLKGGIPKIIRVLKHIVGNEAELRKNRRRIKILDSKLHFSPDDIYFFNDYFCAYPFFELFDYPYCIFVFHAQGSIYNEWEAMSGLKSNYLKKKFDFILRSIAQNARIFAFPAKGAEESVIASDSSLRDVICACERAYLYNGVSCPVISDYELAEWIAEINKNDNEIKFITVANLNAAKAVERIPAYLKKIKDAGISFKWILRK